METVDTTNPVCTRTHQQTALCGTARQKSSAGKQGHHTIIRGCERATSPSCRKSRPSSGEGNPSTGSVLGTTLSPSTDRGSEREVRPPFTHADHADGICRVGVGGHELVEFCAVLGEVDEHGASTVRQGAGVGQLVAFHEAVKVLQVLGTDRQALFLVRGIVASFDNES